MGFVGNQVDVCRAATESSDFCLERPRPCHEHQESRRATPTVGTLPKRIMWLQAAENELVRLQVVNSPFGDRLQITVVTQWLFPLSAIRRHATMAQ